MYFLVVGFASNFIGYLNMHQFRPCKYCNGEAIYIHLPAFDKFPPEHQAICGGCGYKTEIYKYSFPMLREWNRKKKMIKDKDIGRLVIERRIGSAFSIGDDIEIFIDSVRGNLVRVSVTAPKNLKILREELLETKGNGHENGLL